MIRPGGILYLLSIFLALWPAAGIAQTGSVRGSVVDQTGLVPPGATVILRGEGVPRTAYADEQGTFELAGVTPGTYTLTVSLGGFSDATVEDVVVSGTELALPPVELQVSSPQFHQYADEHAALAGRRAQRLPRLLRPRPMGPAPDQLRRRGTDRGGAGAGVRRVGRQRHDRGGQHHHQVAAGVGRHDGDAQRRGGSREIRFLHCPPVPDPAPHGRVWGGARYGCASL